MFFAPLVTLLGSPAVAAPGKPPAQLPTPADFDARFEAFVLDLRLALPERVKREYRVQRGGVVIFNGPVPVQARESLSATGLEGVELREGHVFPMSDVHFRQKLAMRVAHEHGMACGGVSFDGVTTQIELGMDYDEPPPTKAVLETEIRQRVLAAAAQEGSVLRIRDAALLEPTFGIEVVHTSCEIGGEPDVAAIEAKWDEERRQRRAAYEATFEAFVVELEQAFPGQVKQSYCDDERAAVAFRGPPPAEATAMLEAGGLKRVHLVEDVLFPPEDVRIREDLVLALAQQRGARCGTARFDGHLTHLAVEMLYDDPLPDRAKLEAKVREVILRKAGPSTGRHLVVQDLDLLEPTFGIEITKTECWEK